MYKEFVKLNCLEVAFLDFKTKFVLFILSQKSKKYEKSE